MRFHRANQWSFGYPTWLLQKVFGSSDFYSRIFSRNSIAISDAVRTSLGPRGMDKMARQLPWSQYL